MEIKNVRVYGLEESIIASGYPLRTEIPNYEEFSDLANDLCKIIHLDCDIDNINAVQGLKRIKRLANAPIGSGHDCALKGVIVQYDLTAPEYFWRQFDRYHYHDYISSQSKMHCIPEFNINKMCNKYVSQNTIYELNHFIDLYNNFENKSLPYLVLRDGTTIDFTKQNIFQLIISNCPAGFELTARITDNYLQLKSKYQQRRQHELEEWQYYCDWIETLPMAKELIVGRD
jgi:hypothetical protein